MSVSRRRWAAVLLLGGLAVGAAASVAPAAGAGRVADPLPAGTLVFDSNRSGNLEIYALGAGGPRQLTTDAGFDSLWPKVAPDGRTIVFHRTPRGTRDRDYTRASTWVMDADGDGLRVVLPVGAHGWGLQGHAEWSPDGRELALVGGPATNPQVFIVDADGGRPRRVTRDALGGLRPGTNIDPSWSPDGRSLLFAGCPLAVCPDRLLEVYRVDRDGGGETRLTSDALPDFDPYWSPDGATVAWLRNTGTPLSWGIFAMAPDGTRHRAVVDDGATNSKPEWAPDSSAIYFHRAPAPLQGPGGFDLYSVRPDGTGLTRLLPDHRGAYDNEYPDVVGTLDGPALGPPRTGPAPTAAPGPPVDPSTTTASAAPTTTAPTTTAPTTTAPTTTTTSSSATSATSSPPSSPPPASPPARRPDDGAPVALGSAAGLLLLTVAAATARWGRQTT